MSHDTYAIVGYDQYPEWLSFDLKYRRRRPVLELCVARGALAYVLSTLSGDSIGAVAEALGEPANTDDFLLLPGKPLGFGGALVLDQSSESCLRYSAEIPRVEKPGRPCRSCSGEQGVVGECFTCDDTGYEREHDWLQTNRIAATLCVLLRGLSAVPIDCLRNVAGSKQQLMAVQTGYATGALSHAGISASLSQEFSNYLRDNAETELPTVTEAMRRTYLSMLPSWEAFAGREFRACIRARGQLLLDVPGNACGLGVGGDESGLSDPSMPFELECHNVDTNAQMIALLAGLAALAARAREDMNR